MKQSRTNNANTFDERFGGLGIVDEDNEDDEYGDSSEMDRTKFNAPLFVPILEDDKDKFENFKISREKFDFNIISILEKY